MTGSLKFQPYVRITSSQNIPNQLTIQSSENRKKFDCNSQNAFTRVYVIFVNFVVGTLGGRLWCENHAEPCVAFQNSNEKWKCVPNKLRIGESESSNATKCRKRVFYAWNLFLFIEQTIIHNFIIRSVYLGMFSVLLLHESNEFESKQNEKLTTTNFGSNDEA